MQNFADLGALLERTARLIDRCTGDTGPPWAPGSPADIEGEAREFGGAWGPRPEYQAAVLPSLLIFTVRDHVDGMAVLVASPRTMLSQLVVARPVLTFCASIHHLLEPNIDLRERVRRWANIQMSALFEHGNLVQPGTTAREEISVELLAFVKAAESFGYDIDAPRRRDSELMVKRSLLPNMSEMALLDAMWSDGSEVSKAVGSYIYRLTSSFVHAQLHSTMSLANRSSLDDGAGRLSLELDLPTMTSHAATVLVAVNGAVLRLLNHRGMPTRAWTDAIVPIVREMQPWCSYGQMRTRARRWSSRSAPPSGKPPRRRSHAAWPGRLSRPDRGGGDGVPVELAGC